MAGLLSANQEQRADRSLASDSGSVGVEHQAERVVERTLRIWTGHRSMVAAATIPTREDTPTMTTGSSWTTAGAADPEPVEPGSSCPPERVGGQDEDACSDPTSELEPQERAW